MKFRHKSRRAIFSTKGCFPKLSESCLEFQGHLFQTHKPSELELTRYVISGKGLGGTGHHAGHGGRVGRHQDMMVWCG